MGLIMATIRLATARDYDAVVQIVNAAYEKYIARIGRKPMPMLADYAELIARETVHVLEHDAAVCGLVVLYCEDAHVLLENIAVAPNAQGKGIGKRLMQFVEEFTRAQGRNEIRLYTHEKMVENIEIYKHLGYVETERRQENGFRRVFMAKQLA